MTQRTRSARTLVVSGVLVALLTTVAYLWLNSFEPAAIPPTATLPPQVATTAPTNSPLPPSATPSLVPSLSPSPSPSATAQPSATLPPSETPTATPAELVTGCSAEPSNQPNGQFLDIRGWQVYQVYDNSTQPPLHHFFGGSGPATVRADAVRGVLAYPCPDKVTAELVAASLAARGHHLKFPNDYVFGPAGDPVWGLPPLSPNPAIAPVDGVWYNASPYLGDFGRRLLLRLTYDPAAWSAHRLTLDTLTIELRHKQIDGCFVRTRGEHNLGDGPAPNFYAQSDADVTLFETIFVNNGDPECDAAAQPVRDSVYVVPNPAWTPLPELPGCSTEPRNQIDGQAIESGARGVLHVYDNSMEPPLHHFFAAEGSATIRADEVRGVLAYICELPEMAPGVALRLAQAHQAAFPDDFVIGPSDEMLAGPLAQSPGPIVTAVAGIWFDLPYWAPESPPRFMMRMTYDPDQWAAHTPNGDPLNSELTHLNLNCFLRTGRGHGLPQAPPELFFRQPPLGVPEYESVFTNLNEPDCNAAAQVVRDSLYTIPNPAWLLPSATPWPTVTPVLAGCSAQSVNGQDYFPVQVSASSWYYFHVFDDGVTPPLHHFIAAQGSATVRANPIRGVLAFECADQSTALAGALEAAQAHFAAAPTHYVVGPRGEILAGPQTLPPAPATATEGVWYDPPTNAPESPPRVLARMAYDAEIWLVDLLDLDPRRSYLLERSNPLCFMRAEAGDGVPDTPSPFIYYHLELGLPAYSTVFVIPTVNGCSISDPKVVQESMYTVPNPAWTAPALP